VKDTAGTFVQAPVIPGVWSIGYPRTGMGALGALNWSNGYSKARAQPGRSTAQHWPTICNSLALAMPMPNWDACEYALSRCT
jgi:hypothetical protein